MSKPFYILSIDGGGFRGAYSAHILKLMEKKWGVDWCKHFGLIAGTSTGSILAAGLACGITAEKLSQFYADHGKKIFRPRLRSRIDLLKIFTSRYSSGTLRALLEEQLGDKTLGDIPVPLILPSVDIGNGCVHVFKSKYHDGFTRDPEIKVSDAVLASCSAPTYFDPYFVEHVDGKYQLADGGLWANNPSLVSVIDAMYRLQVHPEDIRVLSIGTGKSKVFYPKKGNWWMDTFIRSWQGWGFATRWGRSKLIDFIINLQADTAHNMLCLMLGENPLEPNSVCRVNFESDGPLPMDSTRKLDDWITKADYTFTHKADAIRQFLNLEGLSHDETTDTQ